MKKSYYKNLFLYQLDMKNPVDVLKSSLTKIKDVGLLNEIVKKLCLEDLDEFLDVLSRSTYDLNKSGVGAILYKFPLSVSAYKKFMSLNISNFDECPTNGLLNFCLYAKKKYRSSSKMKFEIYTGELATGGTPSSLISSHSSCFLPDFGKDSSFETQEYYKILKAMYFLNSREVSDEIKGKTRDPLLRAIIDRHGRVSGQDYPARDLLLVDPKQIYNLDDKKKAMLVLCVTNSENRVCRCCGNWTAVHTTEYDTPDFKGHINTLLEDFIVEGNIEKVCAIITHCRFLRVAKYFKFLLKLLISDDLRSGLSPRRAKSPNGLYPGSRRATGRFNSHQPELPKPNFIGSQYYRKYSCRDGFFHICPDDYSVQEGKVECTLNSIVRALDLFVVDSEVETLAVSFLKASSAYFRRALIAIPCLIKTKKTCFASFVTLLHAYQKSDCSYLQVVMKNLIFRFSGQFGSIIDLISVFLLKVDTTNTDDAEFFDEEFLYDRFSVAAELFSMSSESFVQKFIYTIFTSLYPHPRLTQNFVEKNIKYLVIQKILEKKYQEQVNDVDILVGVLFHDHFRGLDLLFKPTVSWFVKKNLSHILFKIKSAYVLGLYGRRCCIYKILKFLLTEINISLYFNYVWPYVEFFLNKEHCICSGYFVEWLRQNYDSKLMSPYLPIPFEKVEDIPVLVNMESKIYSMLARLFSQSKGIRYDPCPFVSNQHTLAEDGFCTSGYRPHFISSGWIQSTLDAAKVYGTVDDHTPPEIPGHLGDGSITQDFRREAVSLYNKLKENVPSYSPRPIIPDHDFLEKFIYHIKSNRLFKSKILRLYSGLSIETKALFGSLKHDFGVDLTPRAPRNIPKTILEKFLLKIDYEKQDLFAFTIQEFLRAIDEPFDPEIESFIEQFRHTKLDYRFKIRTADTLNFESYRRFLESLFCILYAHVRNLEYFKYLVLFDDNVLEYACLCLIKILRDQPHAETSIISDRGVFGKVDTSNKEVLKFLLKINTFIGSEVISDSDTLQYALRVRDFYSIIYCLESDDTNLDLLQMAYYMINDCVRVRGLSSVGANAANSYNSVNLFFDFLLDKNYKAARKCLKEIEKGRLDLMNDRSCATTPSRCEASVGSDVNYRADRKCTAYSAADDSVLRILKDIIETNTEEEIDNFIASEEFTCSSPVLLHILKDLELLRDSDDTQRTIELINERRAISDSPEAILRAHRLLATRMSLEPFSRAIDFEIVQLLRQKKEFQKCEEEIARMILRRELGALYEHALVKIDQRHISEAKELLKRLVHVSKNNCVKNHVHDRQDYLEYFRATVKLCEISKISTLFENSAGELEDLFFGIFLNEEEVSWPLPADTRGHGCDDLCDAREKRPTNETRLHLGRFSQLRKPLRNDLEKLKKMYEKVKQIGNLPYRTSRAQSSCLEAYNYLQRLYFLTAKHFEKTNLMLSIRYYFKSFTSNHEAIPRFFHHIANVPKVHQKHIGEMVEVIIKEHLPNLIPFYNQIITKLSSSDDSSSKFYKSVIRAMLESYPYQTFWNTLILANSKRPEVKDKTMELIENLSLENRLIFKNVLKCSERLTSIAKNTSKQLSMGSFPEIRDMLPIRVNIPGQMTEINSVKDEIVVFHSLQMPKKIVFVGEDGKEYHMIVKYKDDLRKDSRFMDLDDLLNKLFDEGYYIRRYNVIPFTHESGIIEYVPNLCNLKEIVCKYYDNINESIYRYTKYKKIGGNNMGSLLGQFRPVYNKYLKSTYNDPYQFYTVRESYIKTYAIMNVVGWFMGLGDRHTENIHFDKNTGDTVHVDLNCIFDKAKSLEIPEKVPFRLTQNIVDGFGRLGVEGTYKHTMKYTLGLLRDNRDVVQANLLSFVFDPLFEWAKKKTEPTKILDVMSRKLDYEDEDERIEELIEEATDINHLGSMYIGWMSFI